MTIWVVRHGCAGRSQNWPGDDDERPLDEVGRRQAHDIADLLAPRRPGRLRSSPARRCTDTLVALALRLDLPVGPEDGLRPGVHPGGLLALLDAAEAGDVLCTHGEVMVPACAELHRRGAAADLAGEAATLKGVVWEVELAPLSLTVLPPPVRCADGG